MTDRPPENKEAIYNELARLRGVAQTFAEDRPRVERDAWNRALDAVAELRLDPDRCDLGEALRALRKGTEPEGATRPKTMDG